MASTSKDNVPNKSKTKDAEGDDLEPGACQESVLNPSDSFEEFAKEMSSSLLDRNSLKATPSTISEIQSEIGDSSKDLKTAKSSDDLQSKDVSFNLCRMGAPFLLTS